jgi:hypothetical protein
MKTAFLVLASCVAAPLAQSPGIASAANPAVAQAVPVQQSGCFPSANRPNFGTLPSGTRIFFTQVLAIRYPKPGVDVAEARFAAVNGQLEADIRDNTVYVNGKKTPATLSERGEINFQTRIDVCVYRPGEAIPGNFTGLTPDLVLR